MERRKEERKKERKREKSMNLSKPLTSFLAPRPLSPSLESLPKRSP